MSDEEAIPTRHANGQFKEGICPNPKGRPRKPKLDVGERLTAILQEEVTTANGKMPLIEVLFRSYIKETAKDPRLLIKLLPLLASSRSDDAASTVSTSDDQAIIQAFADEEARRRAARSTGDTAGHERSSSDEGDDEP